jgi:hypothetical protein
MKTSVSSAADDLKQPTQMTESETDKVAGGAPKADVGHHYGVGEGLGFEGHGNGKGKGSDSNNDLHGRF